MKYSITLGLLVVTCVGCSTHQPNKQTLKANQPNIRATSSVSSSDLDDMKKEILLGRSIAGKLIAAFGLYGDPQVNQYVNMLGQAIAQNSDTPNRKFSFHILNSSQVNAYAAPGGYIFITRGAILNATNEAELAAVIGHEIAHITNSHVYNTVKALKAKNKKANPLVKVRERVSDSQTNDGGTSGAVVAKMMGGGGTAAIALFKVMANAAFSILMNKGLDQKLEFEADQQGMIYAARAGYPSDALPSFLTRLHAHKSKASKKALKIQEQTHPPMSQRINLLNTAIIQNDLASNSQNYGPNRFGQIKAILAKK